MQIGVIKTDHGKHSNEKLAIACASDIIQIGSAASGQQAMDGRKLENKIIEILEVYFGKLADFEHAEIDAKGTAHLASEAVAHPEMFAGAVTEIMAAIDASSIASWFADRERKGLEPVTREQMEANVSKAVEKWLLSGHHMHRDWFARWGKVGHGTDLKASDKHDPESEHVKAWIAAA